MNAATPPKEAGTADSVVSVLIPCHNHGEFVGAAVESVLAQTHAPLEIIVVDDGSTDDSREVLRGFGDAIRLFTRSNQGIGATYNFLLDQAAGDVVAYLESDDMLEPKYLEKCLSVLDEHPEISWVSTARELMDAGGLPTGDCAGKRTPGPLFTTEGLLTRDIGTSSTPVVRKEALLSVGEFVTDTHAADTDMALRFSTRFGMWYIDEPLYRYRRHDRNMSGSALRDAREVLRILKRFQSEAGDYVSRNRRTVRRAVARFAGRVATLMAETESGVRRSDVLPYLSEAVRLDPGSLKHLRRYILIMLFGPRIHGWRRRRFRPISSP